MSDNDRAANCPYAPRHQPNLRGICEWCHVEVPEPWYMKRRPDPGQMVGEMLANAGVLVAPHVAEKVAAALLGWADRAYEVRHAVPGQLWKDDGFRGHLREHMRVQIYTDLASQGCVPVGLPSEAVRYLAHPVFFDEQRQSEVPRTRVEAGAPYEVVEIILAVPARRPPVDRAAAVRAGLL